MKISELLLEYNENLLVQNFASKIESHAKLDTTAPKNLTGHQLIQNIAKENKKLAFWISLNYANYTDKKFNGGIQRWEDIASKAIPDLEEFKTLLRKPNLSPPLPIRDINQIKGLNALFNILKPYREQEQPITDADEQKFVNSNQVKIVINKPNLKVVVPLTKQAAIFYGGGTQWCTSAKNNNMFSAYSTDGPLYIILAGGEKYQWHFETNQYVDSSDSPIDPIELAMKYPGLLDILSPGTTGNFWDRLVHADNENTRFLISKNPHTPPEILDILTRDTVRSIRVNIADNPSTSPATLLALSTDSDWEVRKTVVHNPNTTSQILINLSNDKNYYIRQYVALNKKTPTVILTKLAKDREEEVRHAVAYNENTPPEALLILAKDNNENVRRKVADHINTPVEALALLASDESYSIRGAVAARRKTPNQILIKLAKDKNEDVRWQVARNLSAPVNALLTLSKDKDGWVRTGVVQNKNTPVEILRQLAKDSSRLIRDMAERALDARKYLNTTED